MIEECKNMLDSFGNKIILPVDTVKDESAETFKIMDIGPETVAKYAGIISEANSIFINGNLGFTEDKRYQAGTMGVVKAISESTCGVKVAAGGDTAGFIDENNLSSGFSFISTGGGAALEFLAGEKLPGIEALK
jgi:phosphoglycerate kinase